MSGKVKLLPLIVAGLLALGAVTAQADVTGSFTTHVQFWPQTTASEIEQLEFDIQNEINLTVLVSGLSTTLHSHFGLAGVEDVQLTYAATLGALDIKGTFVFARFAGACFRTDAATGGDGSSCIDSALGVQAWDVFPDKGELHFVKKRVTASASLGGVTVSNLAIFEDTNFRQPTPTVQPSDTDAGILSQTPAYAFGDVISLAGQTPSGVSISASTGVCAELAPNVIKKHDWQYRVNADCADDLVGESKPNLAFDFETLNISGIPIASGVTSSASVVCFQTSACTLTNTFNFSGVGPVPFTVDFFFTDLFSFTFDAATLTFSTGAGTIEIDITDTGTIAAVEVDLSTTINPDTNPATVNVNANFDPGTGLTDADVSMSVTRSDIDFTIVANFTPTSGSIAEFADVTFSISTMLGALDVETSATFGAFGFQTSSTWFTISF